MLYNIQEIEEFAKTIRRTAVQMAYKTNTSHTGGTLSQADILAVLYSGVMNCSPETMDDPRRDRFIESKGHNCASYYAALALKGFMDYDELMENYCKDGSVYFEHVSHKLPGVELSTGSLGHGFPVAAGMALGSKRSGIPFNVYCIIGDGEINEGSNWEAMMFAHHYELDNLCVIVDNNDLQIDGRIADVIDPYPIPDKFKAFGLNVVEIDGHDFDQIEAAMNAARETKGVPTAIIMKTLKGKGVSFMEDQAGWHGKAPNDEQYEQAMGELGKQLEEVEAM